MYSNNKISHLVSSQLPFFVRNDHAMFVSFLEKYYEYLEQSGKLVNVSKKIQTLHDIDLTEDVYAEKLYNIFMKYIPKNVLADKKTLIKNIKDFYRAKGSEKSVKFLLRIILNTEAELYYPKTDILKVSDGKWYVQKSLRITDIAINNVPNNSVVATDKFVATRIRGQISNATAVVEKTERFYELNAEVNELILSNIDGNFRNGEIIYALFDDGQETKMVSGNVFAGQISAINIINGGARYNIGDPVIVIADDTTGQGACAVVTQVSTGNIAAIAVESGGAGFRANDVVIISGGGGTGANAYVRSVLTDGSVHPNTYSIVSSTISLEANTQLGNAVYSNLSSANINTAISDAVSYWNFSNTGPVRLVGILNRGRNYSTLPTISAVGNTAVSQLGILGRLEILNGGQNYQIGDYIEFVNVKGGYGTGARANVTNVGESNTITEVKFVEVPGHFVGGSGYSSSFLPRANVVSATGNGANIIVKSLLAAGGEFVPTLSTIGSIERITLLDRGFGYANAPFIDLSGSGDGTATANTVIIEGAFTYPGRFLNDDGMVSSHNFIEDRDYYQNFSYVVKSSESVKKYRQPLKELVHPAGMKFFGEIQYNNDAANTFSVSFCYCAVYSNVVHEPAYTLNFTDTQTLDANVVFERNSTGSYINNKGYVAYAGANVARYTHDPATFRREGVLFEAPRTNLPKYSQEFGNTNWIKANVSISPNVITAPDGTMTGDIMYETGNNNHFLYQTVNITANATCSVSLFAKKVTNRDIIRLSIRSGSNSAIAYCNIANGYTTNSTVGLAEIRLNPVAKQLPNNWYRIEFAGSPSETATSVNVQVVCVKSMGDESYEGNASQGYGIWGIQAEEGDCPSSYIATHNTAVARAQDKAYANVLAMGIETANGFSFEVESKYYDLTGRSSSFNTIALYHPVAPASFSTIRVAKGYQPYGYVYHTGWNGSATAMSTGSISLVPGQKLHAVQSFQNNNVLCVSSNGNVIVQSTDTSFEMGLPYLLRINMDANEGTGNGIMTVEKVKLYDRALSNTSIYRIIDGI